MILSFTTRNWICFKCARCLYGTLTVGGVECRESYKIPTSISTERMLIDLFTRTDLTYNLVLWYAILPAPHKWTDISVIYGWQKCPFLFMQFHTDLEWQNCVFTDRSGLFFWRWQNCPFYAFLVTGVSFSQKYRYFILWHLNLGLSEIKTL